MWRLDLDKDVWECVEVSADSQVPQGRCGHTNVVYNGHILVFGGIYERSRDSRKSQNCSYSPGALFDLFDITRPSRKKVARGKGLKFDNELTNRCKEKLKSTRLYSLASDVNVFWNLRLTSTAGLAYHDSARIDLNSSLKRFYPEEPERTLMHELAHLIANYSRQ